MRKFGHAWVTLSLVLAAHAADEALTNFLSLYNPAVRAIRARYHWFPMPTFGFREWLAGLCVLVVVLMLLAPLAYRGSRVVQFAAYPFAAIMLFNGLGHLAGSLYLGYWAPGATTAPLLIAASIWLFACARALPPFL
jgi:Protein of unknown function with HXXEE motif